MHYICIMQSKVIQISCVYNMYNLPGNAIGKQISTYTVYKLIFLHKCILTESPNMIFLT
jgi:hypothetical protein